ncbi:MAG: hypothetical protein DWP97_07025 [Calditrichaeota bacterium]|nr:MAG: hypothetical protein DWP97_07025 [Calditrichota bacterium]
MSVLVIGIGNKYRSDDAVGLVIADSIREKNIHNCSVVKNSGEGISLINLWEEHESVIIIDAVKSENLPGKTYVIDIAKRNLNTDWFQLSTHLFSIPEAIDLAKQLEKLPTRFYFYGVEAKNFEYGEGLSPEVQKAKDILITQIIDGIQFLNKPTNRSSKSTGN